jgi:N6-adenosine-specific RNA methylase IME4
MLLVHAFSPFVYVASFTLPTGDDNSTPSVSGFGISEGSLSSFTTCASTTCKKASADSLNPTQSNIQTILAYLSPPDPNTNQPLLPAHLSLQEEVKSSTPPIQKSNSIDIFQITQLKLCQLSALIDPIIQFFKKCNGNKSQLAPELFYYDDLLSDPSICKRGVVYSPYASVWKTEFGSYYIPNSCYFYWGDVRVGLRSISSLHRNTKQEQEQKQPCHDSFCYNTVVVDPPWRNKSARRGKKYQMGFSNSDLLALGHDLRAVMNPGGCLVAVWVTNNNTFNFVKDKLLAHWGVQFAAVWWWLKVKPSGEALYEENDKCNKKTYERVVIGYYGPHDLSSPCETTSLSLLSSLSSIHPPCSLVKDYCGGDRAAMAYASSSAAHKRSHSSLSDAARDNSEKCEATEDEEGVASAFPAGLLLDSRRFKLVANATDYNSCGFSLSSYQNLSVASTLKQDSTDDCDDHVGNTNDDSGKAAGPAAQRFIFPIHVIASIPVRHSWKPPLQKLLQLSLLSLDQYHAAAPVSHFSAGGGSLSVQQVNDESAGAKETESTSAGGGDLELFAR